MSLSSRLMKLSRRYPAPPPAPVPRATVHGIVWPVSTAAMLGFLRDVRTPEENIASIMAAYDQGGADAVARLEAGT